MTVDQEKRIRTAIEHGGIKRIVIIDDAFDVPVITNEDTGPLLDFLTREDSSKARQKAGLKQEEIDAAVASLSGGEVDNETLSPVIKKMYQKFIERFDPKFDPAGRFKILKGSNLEKIMPLLKLLNGCRGVELVRVGATDADLEMRNLQAEVVFVDYILDGSLTPDSDPDSLSGAEARKTAIRKLSQFLNQRPGAGPSIMLMSSHDLEGKSDQFRRDVRDKKKPIFASRFHFLAKNDLSEDGDQIRVAPRAADALLDIAQQHVFAGAAEDALTHWKAGVEKAVEAVWETVSELELKDLAYLARFRLADEGQPLSSYLEWFFGEVLLDQIARSVNWSQPSFGIVDNSATKGQPGSQIEGAFDGQTKRIAELYERVRIERRLEREGKDMRLGDIYSGNKPDEVLAVVTPACDLVLRRKKRSAPRLTVVAGKLHQLNSPDSSIADFIIHNDNLCNVVWNLKDVRTIEYDRVGEGKAHRLIGTLRPLYANELQRRVVTEMGRIGLAVAPVMGMMASVRVVVRGIQGPLALEFPKQDQAVCAVIPSRGGDDKPRVIYHRSFVEEMIEELARRKEEIHPDVMGEVGGLLRPDSQLILVEKLCRHGQAEGDLAFGIRTSLKPEDMGPHLPWCQILVSHHDQRVLTGDDQDGLGETIEIKFLTSRRNEDIGI